MDLTGAPTELVSAEDSRLLKELAEPLCTARRWIRLFGWMMLGNGVLAVFTGWGILFCWLPIWMGVLLFRAAHAMEVAGSRGDRRQFLLAQQTLKTFFTLNGVLMLVGTVVSMVLLVIFGGIMIKLLPRLLEQGSLLRQGGLPSGP